FKLKGSGTCFRFFNDKTRSWENSKKKCEEEGLLTARASDNEAVPLRKYLLDTYGDEHWVWLDARGDRSKFVWQQDWTPLNSNNPLWEPGRPGRDVTPDYCLGLLVRRISWQRAPLQPYDNWLCSNSITT
ncbi:unnamed protein product, partial [Meganyctiphanes norvegica]